MKIFKDRVNWATVEGGGSICSYNASAGYRGMKSEAQAIAIASKVYKIPEQPTVALMVEAIKALLPRERRNLVKANGAPLGPIEPWGKSQEDRLVVPTTKKSRSVSKCHTKEDKLTAFYNSWEWKRLSYAVKQERGRRCECCGAMPPDVRIITDHIKPIRHYWHLRLQRSNLQVLCEDCNRGKGSRDETDFRPAGNIVRFRPKQYVYTDRDKEEI